MDAILKMAEEVNRRLCAETEQNKKIQIQVNGYVSMFTIDGLPILPPLMTPERRLEMQLLKQLALNVENRLTQKRSSKAIGANRLESELTNHKKHTPARMLGGDAILIPKFVDASTNTVPINISDKSCKKQILQRSETLIYDNKYNAIIKPMKSCNLAEPKKYKNAATCMHILQEMQVNRPQFAVQLDETASQAVLHTTWLGAEKKEAVTKPIVLPVRQQPLLSMVTSNELSIDGQQIIERRSPPKPVKKARKKTAEAYNMQSVMESVCCRDRSLDTSYAHTESSQTEDAQTAAETHSELDSSIDQDLQLCERDSILVLMNATRQLQQELAFTTGRQRATTSPALKRGRESLCKSAKNKCAQSGGETAKADDQRWKRCNSYPLPTVDAPLLTTSPQNTATIAPPSSPYPTGLKSNNKIEVKQRMAPTPPPPPPQLATPVNQRANCKTMPAKSMPSTSNRQHNAAAAQRSTGSSAFAAHACSHANMQNSTDTMSSIKRRLSYDPRASLKRSSQQKKSVSGGSSNNNKTMSVKHTIKSAPPATPNNEQRTHKGYTPPNSPRQSISPSPLLPLSARAAATAAATTLRTSCNRSTPQSAATSAPSSQAQQMDQLKRKMLNDLGQQQRQRFQQLVNQQAEEQKRLQAEFDAKQQTLIDQLLCDMNSYSTESIEGLEQLAPQQQQYAQRGAHSRSGSPANCYLRHAQQISSDDDSSEESHDHLK